MHNDNSNALTRALTKDDVIFARHMTCSTCAYKNCQILILRYFVYPLVYRYCNLYLQCLAMYCKILVRHTFPM